jgi:hypothetical protein
MAIQQHALPQDISSYRFRLIGDMTLKQFASLGICILLAIISYSLPLPFFFKYPIVFMFLLLGIGMAFVPVQGRSLDIWLIAFIKSIYSPTQYTWKRTPATTESTETAVPTKENNIAVTRPVSNPNIEITQSPNPIPEPTITAPIAPAASEFVVPQTANTTSPSTPPVIQTPVSTPITSPTTPVNTSIVSNTIAPTVNLPIPFTPTTPNTLVGLTLTPSGNILDGVLVEIKKDNLTLRATKSNKLGQFMFARPLESGLYQILAEKDTLNFVPYSLELTGEIVKPLKIQAQISSSHT